MKGIYGFENGFIISFTMPGMYIEMDYEYLVNIKYFFKLITEI